MSEWKDEVFKAAMKVMQNPTAQKVISNDKVQKTIAGAFKASFSIKNELDGRKAEVAKKLNLATSDDLRTMKRELDRLQRQVARLKKQNDDLKTDK